MEQLKESAASTAVECTTSCTVSDIKADTSNKHPEDPPFIYPEWEPVVDSNIGILYDFNHGLRIRVLKESVPRRIVILESISGAVIHDNIMEPGAALSISFIYYMEYILQVFDKDTNEKVYEHVFSLEDKDVFIQMPYKGALGDTIAWFAPIPEFHKRTKCRLHVLMPEFGKELFIRQYPGIMFETLQSAPKLRPYATYYIGLFFGNNTTGQPQDFRKTGLAQQCANILGMEDWEETPPSCAFGPRTIQERYVCIATQASTHAKCWNNPHGWYTVVNYLRKAGYRVLCIDRDPITGSGDTWHYIPNGAEDLTGCRPLQERLDIIRYADAFIGLSSGLSWVAWCTGTPIVLISGICEPFGEFHTPYRVHSRQFCHGCWNDTRYEFDHKDYMWCPVHKGTPRAYECTKTISPKAVVDAFNRIPGVLSIDAGTKSVDKDN